MDSLSVLLFVYAAMAQILFCVLAWYTSMNFEALKREINQQRTTTNRSFDDHLLAWNHTYNLICASVDQINRFFGPMLICCVTFTFGGMVSSTYYVVRAVMADRSLSQLVMSTSFLLEYFVYFYLMTYSADRVRVKVISSTISGFETN
jgi:7tm Chemosensory receptor